MAPAATPKRIPFGTSRIALPILEVTCATHRSGRELDLDLDLVYSCRGHGFESSDQELYETSDGKQKKLNHGEILRMDHMYFVSCRKPGTACTARAILGLGVGMAPIGLLYAPAANIVCRNEVQKRQVDPTK